MDSENKKKKQIAILGSTGSIGTQALQVIEEHPDLYEAYALTANNRVELLIAQARKFQPEVVVIAYIAKIGGSFLLFLTHFDRKDVHFDTNLHSQTLHQYKFYFLCKKSMIYACFSEIMHNFAPFLE